MCELGVCNGCGDDKMCFHDAEELPNISLPKQDSIWRVVLFCGNCENVREVVISQAKAEEFDEWHNATEMQMWRSLKTIQQVNMSQYIDRFVAALESDALLPEDF
jgi:hypothetical protein